MKLIVASPKIPTKERKILEHHLRKALPAIERRFGARGPRDSILRARLTSEGALFHLTLSMQLPGVPVVVSKEGEDLRTLVSQCEAAFKTEVARGAAKKRREYQRIEGRLVKEALSDMGLDGQPPLPETNVGTNGKGPKKEAPEHTAEPADATREFEAIRPLLGPLYKYARRLIRTAVLAGELPDRYLSPDDLVDQAILNVLELKVHITESDRRLEQSLYREVEVLMAKEVAEQHPGDEERVSLESSANEIENPRFALRGDEDQDDSTDPGESLHIEDILVDMNAHSPAEVISESEEYRALLKYLGRFHSKARSAFFLSRIEGFEPFEVAMIQNRDEEAVRSDIERCAIALQQGYSQSKRGGSGSRSIPLA